MGLLASILLEMSVYPVVFFTIEWKQKSIFDNPTKHSNNLISKPFGSFLGTCTWTHEMLQNFLVDGCVEFGLDKTVVQPHKH